MKKVAVVGAGMAGLAAARALRQSGFSVAIFEKSTRAGGRVTSHQVGGAVFDSGAQNVKSENTELERVLATLQNDERVYIDEPISLRDGARVLAGDEKHNAAPKWSHRGGINGVARLLARDAKSRGARFFYQTTVAALRENEIGLEGAPRVLAPRETRSGYENCDDDEANAATAPPGRVASEENVYENRDINEQESATDFSLLDADGREIFRADCVILTCPLPQSAALLQASRWHDKAAADARLAILKSSEYSRCLSVLLRYESELSADWYALLSQDRAAPLLWLAREECKGFASGGSALVAQLGDERSRKLWSEDDAEIARLTANDIAKIVGESFRDWQSFLVKRWRYSQPKNIVPFDEANPFGARVLVAGDGTAEGRVAAAYQSGLRAAARVWEIARS